MAYEQLYLSHQFCFPLYAASKAVTRQYIPLLKETGLTYTQYIAMLALYEHGSMDVQDLGKVLYLDSGTLSPLLKKLEAAGYIEKTRGEDARFVTVEVTEKGFELREKLSKIPSSVACCIPLKKEEAIAMIEGCKKILEAFE